MLRVLFLPGLLIVLTAGAVFGARLPNQYVCVTLGNYNNERLMLFDLGRNLVAPETRYAPTIGWVTPSDEYTFSTTAHPHQRNTYSLSLQTSSGATILLEEAIYLNSPSELSGGVVWSADQQQFAYLWQDADQDSHLSIFNPQYHHKRSLAIDIPNETAMSFSMFGWSGDGRYLAFGERDSLSTFKLTGFVDVEHMTVLPTPGGFPRVTQMAWSPAGHQMSAIVRLENNQQRLVMLDPAHLGDFRYLEVDRASTVQGISWSGDSRYFTLVRQGRLYGFRGNGTFQWFFDIYSASGELVERDLVGKVLSASTSGGAGSVISPTNLVPGFWSLDGRTWNYLEERRDHNHSHIRLKAYDPVMETFETLAADIATNLYQQMYTMPPRYGLAAITNRLPENHSLVIPQWRADGIALDYVDYRDNRHLPLVTGADEVLTYVFSFGSRSQFLWNDDFFVIPWVERVEGERNIHVSVLRSADGERVIDVAGLDTLSQISYVSQDWISFIAGREGEPGVELVNLTTGAHHRIPVEIEANNGFYVSISPDTQNVAVVITPNAGGTNTDLGPLYLASLEDGTAQVVHESASPYGRWIPDSSAYGFIWLRQGIGGGLQVVDLDGSVVYDARYPNSVVGTSNLMYDLSQCDLTTSA